MIEFLKLFTIVNCDDQVRKETLLPSELSLFQNHSSQMAALDYMVSLASDIFIPSYDGNMARVVEGHRRSASLDSDQNFTCLFIILHIVHYY